MPKSRTRKPKNTRPKTSTAPSVYEGRRRSVGLLIDRLTPEYVAWASRGEDDVAAFAAGQLGIVKAFVTVVQTFSDGAPNLRLDPEHVAGFLRPFLDDVASMSEDESTALDDQRYVVGTLIDWLSFLEETDRWEGTAEDLAAVSELLDAEAEALGGIVDATPRDNLPQATEEEAAEFASRAPFVTRAKALLDWLGPGREADDDGALPPSALSQAGGIVGSEARARRLWEAMLAAELVMLDGGVARPGEGAADLGAADAMGRLEAQFLATELVIAACSATPGSEGDSAARILESVLARGVQQEPFPLEDIASLGSEASEDLGLEEELGPDAAEQLRSMGEMLLAEIRELEELGLVDTSDGMVAVPVAALDAVYDAVLDDEVYDRYGDEDDDSEDAGDDDGEE
ncbi:hypothetical protein [Sinomonas mesophila]|uniref:hypothetical protein n=1 Tax=Sinomonas mesophila TaxID=1531955 RepID=UPI00098572C5|nr:hypothetical protein [Sinomonas mesophila]